MCILALLLSKDTYILATMVFTACNYVPYGPLALYSSLLIGWASRHNWHPHLCWGRLLDRKMVCLGQRLLGHVAIVGGDMGGIRNVENLLYNNAYRVIENMCFSASHTLRYSIHDCCNISAHLHQNCKLLSLPPIISPDIEPFIYIPN